MVEHRGMYDDFAGHRVPSGDEVAEALRSATVVVDTNVLFNLYRRSNSYREDLFAVLEKVGDRLFVPHQVVREYWRNRLGVIADRGRKHTEVLRLIDQNLQATDTAIGEWAQSAALGEAATAELTAAVAELQGTLHALIAPHAPVSVSVRGGPAGDPVLRRLESLLAGRVGAALPEDEWVAAVARGVERVEKHVPPGYLDAEKADSGLPEGPAGDYLVWSQAMAEVAGRGGDLVMITDDQKEDWWLRQRSTVVGARPELVRELHEDSGARLFLLRTSDLLQRADAIEVPVRAESVTEARRAEWAPWTADGVALLLARMEDEALPQVEVIRRAAQLGGYIDRAEVYAVCGFTGDRLLTGFTKPINRITRDLQYEGLLPEGVSAALTPIYDSPGRAMAFRVPDDLVDILAAEA